VFDETFRVCFADNPYGVVLHQRIRYQVYRVDKGYLFPHESAKDSGPFSPANETDEWDDQSAHFIVQNRKSKLWVAATRLVLPGSDNILPVDALGAFDREQLDEPGLVAAEISRFSIISNRSKKAAVSEGGDNDHMPSNWKIGPVGKHQQFEVTLGMMRAVGIYALKRKIDHCILMITDPFARMLRTLGVTIRQVGPPTEFLGTRTTYLVNMREAVSSMSKRSSSVRALFRRSRHAYVRLSSVSVGDTIDTVSEFAPDHSLFNETIFRDTVLLPAEKDSSLRAGWGN
jgi:N-acyl amino acid synthase of PEP-CTERM/exosortase system